MSSEMRKKPWKFRCGSIATSAHKVLRMYLQLKKFFDVKFIFIAFKYTYLVKKTRKKQLKSNFYKDICQTSAKNSNSLSSLNKLFFGDTSTLPLWRSCFS